MLLAGMGAKGCARASFVLTGLSLTAQARPDCAGDALSEELCLYLGYRQDQDSTSAGHPSRASSSHHNSTFTLAQKPGVTVNGDKGAPCPHLSLK